MTRTGKSEFLVTFSLLWVTFSLLWGYFSRVTLELLCFYFECFRGFGLCAAFGPSHRFFGGISVGSPRKARISKKASTFKEARISKEARKRRRWSCDSGSPPNSSETPENLKDTQIRRQNPGAFLGTTKETKTPLFGTFWAPVLSGFRWLKVAKKWLKVA